MGLLSRARSGLAGTLRRRVAGPDAAGDARRIWQTPGPRWFTHDDPIARVHGDATMFVGGLRALLLQSLHPLAMAGVAGHSGYKSDPWGRLQRTSAFIATTTFGTIDDAEAVIAHIRSVHQRVRGRAEDGRRYSASDPHLLTWVHVAEIDSFLAAYQRFAPTALTPVEADTYVEQTGVVASRLGVPDPPATLAELRTAVDSYRPELAATAAAREAARFLLLHPPLPLAARPGYAMLTSGAVALLPHWARGPLGLVDVAVVDRLVALPLGDVATRMVRWALATPVQGDGFEVDTKRAQRTRHADPGPPA